VAPLEDQAGLERAFRRADVVLACAGPFQQTGPALQAAALAAGTHLLDLTGEPAYCIESQRRDAAAREAGIAIVHSVGFDVVPVESLARLATRPLGPVELLEIAVAHTAAVPSRGTLKSYLGMVQGGEAKGLELRDGELVVVPIGAHKQVVELPAPFGPRAAATVPSAEVVLLPRAMPVRNLRYYLATVAPAALAVADKTLPQFSTASLQKSLSFLEGRGESGPEAASREQSRFAVWARATAPSGQQRTMVMTGMDPYGLTAVLATELSLQAAAPDFAARGVLTPTQAFDPQRMLATMAQQGVRWSVVS
jgi:short subunit dehydrogenase-like uncharacterized protein